MILADEKERTMGRAIAARRIVHRRAIEYQRLGYVAQTRLARQTAQRVPKRALTARISGRLYIGRLAKRLMWRCVPTPRT
jgi:hypothetical protein